MTFYIDPNNLAIIYLIDAQTTNFNSGIMKIIEMIAHRLNVAVIVSIQSCPFTTA